MSNTVQISARQYSALVSLYIIGSAILIIPSTLASAAKQDAWISGLLALITAILILPLYRALGSRFSSTGMASFAEAVLGRLAGKCTMLLFLAAAPFLIAALTLRNIGDFLTTQIMPETPIQAVHILFLCIVVMGVRLGLEPIARTAEIFFPFVVLLLILLICMISPKIEPLNVLPLLENGIKPVVKGSFSLIAFPFLECAFLIMLLPSVEMSKDGDRALLKGILFGGIVLVAVTALSILVHGSSITARQAFPSYILARKINIAGIIDRIEIIVAFIWFITTYIRLTLLVYITATGLAETFRLKDHRGLAFPLAFILLTLSIVIVPNATFMIELVPVWAIYATLWGLVFPLTLLVIAAIRGPGRPSRGSDSL